MSTLLVNVDLNQWRNSFAKSPFAKRLMIKRVLFIRNQLGLVFVYKSVESDKKKYRIGFT